MGRVELSVLAVLFVWLTGCEKATPPVEDIPKAGVDTDTSVNPEPNSPQRLNEDYPLAPPATKVELVMETKKAPGEVPRRARPTQMKYTPGGRYLLVECQGANGESAVLYDMKPGADGPKIVYRSSKPVPTQEENGGSTAISPDGRVFAAMGRESIENGILELYDTTTGKKANLKGLGSRTLINSLRTAN